MSPARPLAWSARILLWLWVGAALAAYLMAFRPLFGPILAELGLA